MKYVRAALRAAIAVPMLAMFGGLTMLQSFVVGPYLKNDHTIPRFIYNTMNFVFGYRVEFNKAAAPIVSDKRVMYVANHLALTDFVVLGSVLKGAFAGKSEILTWPVIAPMARALKFIGLRRSSEYNDESRANIIKNFNEGRNTILFPEGTTSDGKQVNMFRAALISPLFGEKAGGEKPVQINGDVVLQPVAIRVKAIDGVEALNDDKLRNMYSMPTEPSILREFWKRLQIKRTVIELTPLPALDPKNFSNAKDLINKAAAEVAGIVNPGQTAFIRVAIPGQPVKP